MVIMIPGVDAIIHVASPLANAASPQVILDVRYASAWDPLAFLTFQKLVSVLDRRLRYNPHPRRRTRCRSEAAHHHSKHRIARIAG
jgi:hypothetical protein